MPEYRINIDKRVLRLLGAQLYGDTPSIISELVQNSYDADAQNVWITINTAANKESIIVEDDGIGMTPTEINDRFLNIGANRREEFTAETPSGRKVLGRKGIGKLAVFSLAKMIDVYSSKEGELAGCRLDFDAITLRNQEPESIEPILFENDRLSANQSGTRIELYNIQKSISRSINYIINRLTRSFDLNADDFTVYVQRNKDGFKKLSRAELDYYSHMDTLITIGEGFEDIQQKVENNTIPTKYQYIRSYSDLPTEKGRIQYQSMPYKITVTDENGNDKDVLFSIKGWIGTVHDRDSFKNFINTAVDDDADNATKFEVSVNDNRISVFSRGKMGEYNILPKTQTNRIADAYIIGEIYADIFEDDDLTDMAISNRRGYDEADQRYVHMIDIVSKIVRFITLRKQDINSNKRKDSDRAKAQEIKDKMISKSPKTKAVLQEKLSPTEIDTFQDELMQFGRVLNLDNATKKIFISHKTDCSEYGKYLVRVFELIGGSELRQSIIFSALPDLGVPHGRDIYEYLKECFRDDLYVIFLFSKSFYNSNVCIAETGAAWATNKNYSNVVIDIGFGDVSEPINRNSRGARLNSFDEPDCITDLVNLFITVLHSVGFSNLASDTNKIENAVNQALVEYADKLNGLIYMPNRNFLAAPICTACSNPMELQADGVNLKYVCTSRNCGNEFAAEVQ